MKKGSLNFLDDPKLLKKHRKVLRQIEKERDQRIAEARACQRFGDGELEIRIVHWDQ